MRDFQIGLFTTCQGQKFRWSMLQIWYQNKAYTRLSTENITKSHLRDRNVCRIKLYTNHCLHDNTSASVAVNVLKRYRILSNLPCERTP